MEQVTVIGTIILAVIVIIAFLKAIVEPIIKLNTNIAELNFNMKNMCNEMKNIRVENNDAHAEFENMHCETLQKFEKHEVMLATHDTKISVIENQIDNMQNK